MVSYIRDGLLQDHCDFSQLPRKKKRACIHLCCIHRVV